MHCVSYSSPIGNLNLFANSEALVKIEFGANALPPSELNSVLKNTVQQLDEYFQGRRTGFDLKLEPRGTDFQRSVWEGLQSIPYGSTCSYGDLANVVKKPKAARAVGQANNRNPLPIIIPCHRVIGANKALVGYGGGLPIKKWLLEHESNKNIVNE